MVICLDDSVQISLSGAAELRISLSEAGFSRIEPSDLPLESLEVIPIPKFECGVRIEMAKTQTYWYLLASEPSPDAAVPATK